MKKRYPRPRKRTLDQAAVAEFLKTIDFQVKHMVQEWRHLTAFGMYQRRPAVFKLASTLKVARYTRNEWAWNDAVNAVPVLSRPHLLVPTNLAEGMFGRLFYLIAEFYPGEPLAQGHEVLSDRVAELLPLIAQVTREIELLPLPLDSQFGRRHTRRKNYQAGERLLSSAIEWAAQVPLNLDKYLQVIEQARPSTQTSPAHGDFVLRQMFVLDDKIGLIDGEHAGLKAPRHYDVAQLYIRLRHDFKAHALANQYLQLFKALLTPAEKTTFWEEIKPVLLQRYIGDLWGSAKNPAKLQELELVGQEILSDQIVTH